MKNRVLGSLLGVGLLVVAATALAASGPSAEEAGVKACVELYFQGAATHDAKYFEQAWDVEAGHMKYVRADESGVERVHVRPIAEAIPRWCDGEPQESGGKILDINVVDDKMAVATVELLFKGTVYIDSLSLYKVGGEWKIVNKLFVSRK